jgi:enoyl-CoA hydratase
VAINSKGATNAERVVFVNVTTATKDDVLLTVIDDGKANALSFEVLEELQRAIASATAERKNLVITGREGYFCAGFDLSVMRGGDPAQVTALVGEGRRLFRGIVEAPVAVVVVCTGHALAAGALLLLAADYRVGGAGDFKIGLNEVTIGLSLPEFAMAMARHRIGAAYLTSATLLSQIFTPDDACDVGFLDVVDHNPLASALAAANRLGGQSKDPFATTKQRLRVPLLAEWDDVDDVPHDL